MHRTDLIAIGELAARTGVAVSAIRFYEAKGLVEALRTGGGEDAQWRRLDADQHGVADADRCADRGARMHARIARQLHWMRLPQPQEMRAL